MLDLGHLPSNPKSVVQVFGPNTVTANTGWSQWTKPRGIAMVYFFAVGAGGGGGDAVAGAASTAAGGGGGGSGGQTTLLVPAMSLPDTLFLTVARGVPNNTSTTAGAGVATRVCIAPTAVANDCLLIANSGASGGKSAGSTPGAVGTAGAIANINTMPLAGMGTYSLLAGQVGIIGSNTSGAALALPVTGLVVTGGTGGAGVPASNTAGNAGGLMTGVAGSYLASANIPGGTGGTTAPTAGGDGRGGMRPFKNLIYGLGGTGGGSCGLTAVPAGAAGGNGGRGAPGCGGGGGGGAFTASAFGIGGLGGDSFVIIACW